MKVFGIVLAVLVVLFIIIAVFGPGPGGHGSGRHTSSFGAGEVHGAAILDTAGHGVRLTADLGGRA